MSDLAPSVKQEWNAGEAKDWLSGGGNRCLL